MAFILGGVFGLLLCLCGVGLEKPRQFWTLALFYAFSVSLAKNFL